MRDDTKPWSECSVQYPQCGQGIQTRLAYNCSCGDVCACGDMSLCGPPPPEEMQPCNNTDICCQFAGQPVTTSSCQIISNCTGISWTSQQCTCPDSRGSTACDISYCSGVPSSGTPPCTCTQTPVCEWREIVSNCTGQCTSKPADSHDTKSKRGGSTDEDCDEEGNPTNVPTPKPNPVSTNQTGTQTVTRNCFCNGVLVENSKCSPVLPNVQTRSCALNCSCTWINITDWCVCSASCGDSNDSKTKRGGNSPPPTTSYSVTGTQSLTRRCSCDAVSKSTTSTYSNACGGETVLQRSCTVQCQSTSRTQKMTDTLEMNAKLSSTSETSNQQSSFLLIFIPTIIVVAIIGIAATLVFIKTRNKLVINTTKSHHRLQNETDNTLV